MKKIFLIATIFASSFIALNAQDAAAGDVQVSLAAKAKEMVAQINTITPLQGEQFGTLNNLFLTFYKDKEAMKSETLTAEEKQKKMAELRTTLEAGLNASLTPLQAKLVKENFKGAK